MGNSISRAMVKFRNLYQNKSLCFGIAILNFRSKFLYLICEVVVQLSSVVSDRKQARTGKVVIRQHVV